MPYIGNQPGTGVRSRFIYTATASQTTFSGADNNSKTLKYSDADYIDVYLNGVCLVPVTDYAASTKTSVVLTQAASLNDTLEVVAYDIATISDTVSKADGGTFEDGVTIRTADNTAQLTLESTDADASVGPLFKMKRSSGSAADNDAIGEVTFNFNNDAEQETIGTRMRNFIIDASDGTEDAAFDIFSMKGGSLQSIINYDSNTLVFNDSSQDIDFRVESDNTGSALFVQGSDGNVGLSTTSPAYQLDLQGGTTNNERLRLLRGTDDANQFITLGWNNISVHRATTALASGMTSLSFNQVGSDGTRTAAMIDTAGRFLVGKTSSSGSTVGGTLESGSLSVTTSGGQCGRFNRLSSDGDVLQFRQDNADIGSIGVNGDRVYLAVSGHGVALDASGNSFLPTTDSGGNQDNFVDIGASSARFDDIYATNGTIQTSDETEKQDIASLTSAEITAATAISKLFKTYKWKDKVAAKGDNARTHTGVVAQQVQTAMADAGLDASKYAFWCSDTWWEKDVEVAAVEADEENDIEAADAYTRTDHYYTKDAAPEGATERTRMGIRYPELLAFVSAATEQRLTSIEARLTALEAE